MRSGPAVVGGLAVALLVLVATSAGVDQPPDGTTYAGVARNLADGKGPTSPFVAVIDPFGPRRAVAFDGQVPLLGWPPAYPAMLATGVAAGMEPTQAARWLGAVAAGATTAAVMVLVRLLTRAGRSGAAGMGSAMAGGSAHARIDGDPGGPAGLGGEVGRWLVAAVAAAVVVVQPWFAISHVVVASEPVFLTLSLLALGLGAYGLAPTVGGVGRGAAPVRSHGVLAAAVLVAALASGVRFVGLAVVAALVLAIALVGPGPWYRRLRMATVAGFVGVAPSVLWSRYARSRSGEPLRTLEWHPPGWTDLELALSEAVAWVVPREDPTALRVAALVLLVGLCVAAVGGWRRALRAGAAPSPARPWLLLVACATVFHVGVVVATRAFADRALPLNGRLLLPVLAPLAVSIAAGVVWWWRLARPAPLHRTTRTTSAALAAAAVVLVGGFLVEQSGPWRGLLTEDRSDPAEAAAAAYIRDLGAPLVAANDPAFTWRTTGAQVIVVPRRFDNASGRANPDLDAHLDELAAVLRDHGGVVVLHEAAAFANPGLVGVEELTRRAGLVVVGEHDGVVVLAPSERSRLGSGTARTGVGEPR